VTASVAAGRLAIRAVLKWTGAIFGLAAIIVAALAINVIWFRPFDIRIFYEKVFVEFALEYPEFLSSMRLLEQFGIESHNDDLDDISPAQTLRYNAIVAEALETLREYDRTDLNGQVALSYDILEWYLQTEVDGAEFAFHGYPVNQQFGEQNAFPLFMTSTHYLGDRGDAQDYVTRLGKLDRKFAGLLEDLRLRESRGIVPPRFVIDRVLEGMRGFVSSPARDNILYQSFERRISDIANPSNESRTALLDDAAHQIEQTVYPAYNDLIDYFVALRPKVTTNHGALALPDGRDWYAWLLRRATTTDMTPEAVHAMGLTEVARIEAEMDAILGAEGYTDGSVGERMQQLADEPRFLYPDTDAGRQAILADYRAIIAELEPRLGELFGRLPRSRLEVVPVPEYHQENAAVAYYQEPSFDGGRPGHFYVNLRDVEGHPKFTMRALACHEAVPGHHFEASLRTELTGVAQFRKVIPFIAFQEGWGLYSEQLCREAGFIDDPYDDLGRLQLEMMRAVRLVVDTGIHAQGWSREQAIDYLRVNTGIAGRDVVSEIERYFVNPGQATAYKVGMHKLLELRERAQSVLGDEFDLRQFHDLVLDNGSMPLIVLERQVEDFIVRQSNGTRDVP